MVKASTGALLILILLLATSLRVYRLEAQSLWNDEGTSVALAQRDLAAIARDAARDIHPPLYYWLLHGWLRLTGSGEAALRALSALLGVLLVALTYALGRSLASRWVGLVAALLAAVNSFQVYYSQEMRMYMLAAVLAAGSALALIRVVKAASWPTLAVLVLLETAGLYTHYSFVFVILVLNLAIAGWLLSGPSERSAAGRSVPWLISQAIVAVLYLPWLPTALRQVTSWPTPVQTSGPGTALAETWRWLILGPTAESGQVLIPLLLAACLGLWGIVSLMRGWVGRTEVPGHWAALLLVLWVGLPVLLVIGLGLYREAYLKFLLVTTPATSLLLACGLLSPQGAEAKGRRGRVGLYLLRAGQVLMAAVILIGSGLALQNYYADPAYARDDYRAIAAYVEAVGRAGDAVLLNAPGQSEVFQYYYEGRLPVYPLPKGRPLDPAATAEALAELLEPGGRVFAVLWATDESDPGRFVEGWLDEHTYKARDSWYGNVRLAVYAVPAQMSEEPDHLLGVPLKDPRTGDEITLVGYSLLNDQLRAGGVAQVTLFWQVSQTPAQRYKVFLHALDAGNHIVGQRDAEPGGGARLTTLWQPGQMVVDNHGVPIHPATPPGEYRLEMGMYDPETGQRLITPEGAAEVWLEPLSIERPVTPVPEAGLGMQNVQRVEFGDVALLGYDAYPLGFGPTEAVSLWPGDVLHVNLYWQAVVQPEGVWQVVVSLVDAAGRALTSGQSELVTNYPTSQWQSGDVWRGQFDLPIPGDASAQWYRLQVQPLAPDGSSPEPFLSERLRVGP